VGCLLIGSPHATEKRNVLPLPGSLSTASSPPINAHELPRDGEPQPGAAEASVALAVGLFEGREDARAQLGWNADAGVTDGAAQEHVARDLAAQAHDNLPAGRELDRVVAEIDEDLADAMPIRVQHLDDVGIDLRPQHEALVLGAHDKRLRHLGERLAHVEVVGVDVELASLDLREVEDVVEDLEQALGRPVDRLDVPALLGRQLSVECQLGHADDAVHRGADLVAHVREELALCAIGTVGGVLCAQQVVGEQALPGDVPVEAGDDLPNAGGITHEARRSAQVATLSVLQQDPDFAADSSLGSRPSTTRTAGEAYWMKS